MTIDEEKDERDNYKSACGLTSIDEFDYLIDVHDECSKMIARYKYIIDNTKLLVNANISGAINPARNHPAARSVQNEAYIPKVLEDKRIFLIKSPYHYTTYHREK